MKSLRLKIFISALFLTVIYACSDDRLTALDQSVNPDDISNKDFKDFYDSALLKRLSEKSKVRKITINNASQAKFSIANGGTCTCTGANLRTAQGTAVSYPYDLEILELFTLKDMLLHQKSTESYGKMLVTGGAIYLKATKDGNDLIVNNLNPPQISIPNNRIDTQMQLFYEGMTRQDQFTWVAGDSSIRQPTQIREPLPLVFNKTTYELFPKRLGWINVDKFYDFTGAKTKVKFTSFYPKIENMAIFMVFSDINSVIQVSNAESLEVPVGQTAKIVAVSETKEKEVFSFFKDITVEDKQSIEIKLTKTTEDDFLKALDKL
jgi:hypothetical protein